MIVDARIVLLLAAGCCAVVASSEEKPCKPGERWKVGCNVCVCGNPPRCTDYACHEDAFHPTRALGQCKPFSRWKVDCNYCSCSEFGLQSCTDYQCSPNSVASNRLRRHLKPLCGRAGKIRVEDCRQCICLPSGDEICIDQECSSAMRRKRSSTKVKRNIDAACDDGEKWKEDCNVCTCDENAQKTCTTKICSPLSKYYIMRGVGCKPGFVVVTAECITCSCSPGGDYVCTSKKYECPMVEQVTQINVMPSSCYPGKIRSLDACNYCWCDYTGTEKCSSEDCTSLKDKCLFRRYWVKDCYICYCDPKNGVTCNPRNCQTIRLRGNLAKSSSLRGFATRCNPGDRWKDHCGLCVCLPEALPSCEARLCRYIRNAPTTTPTEGRECRPTAKTCESSSLKSDSQAIKRDGGQLKGRGRCTPGSTWEQNCSSCFCDGQGNPVCIERACYEDELVKKSKELIEGPKGRGRCEPGSTWQLACNVCTCDQNGNIECTVDDCEKKDSTEEGETRKKRAVIGNSKRWCKPGESYLRECDRCPCGLRGIRGCNYRTCFKLY